MSQTELKQAANKIVNNAIAVKCASDQRALKARRLLASQLSAHKGELTAVLVQLLALGVAETI